MKVLFKEYKQNFGKLIGLFEFSEFLQECCQKNHVPPSDGKGFTPHITIAKLSKVSFQIKKKGNAMKKYK